MSSQGSEETASSQEEIEEIIIDEPDSDQGPTRKRKLTSNIHGHYTINGNQYCCKYCSAKYKKSDSGTTSTLRRHISKSHPQKLVAVGNESGCTDIKKFITGVFEKPITCSTDSFKHYLLNYIIATDQPFSSVEEKSFRTLIKLLRPEIDIPSRNTVRKEIEDRFAEQRTMITSKLKQLPGKLSFIIDCWTSSNQKAFLGIIVQGITRDWELFVLPLDLIMLEGPHTGENIASAFLEALKEFSLEERIHSVTTDNASNMDTFFTCLSSQLREIGVDFEEKDFRVRCTAHILNLCCQDALSGLRDTAVESDDIDDLDANPDVPCLSKLTKIIRYIRSSPQRRENFHSQCEYLKIDVKELILDVSTRWNSSYLMIQRAIELRKAIERTVRLEPALHAWEISDEEWKMMELMMEFLQPFQAMTKLMSSQKFPTISFCALVYSQIFEHLEQYKVEPKRGLHGKDPSSGELYPAWLRDAANKAYEKLDKYYFSTDALVCVVGTVLDPRCKLDWFKASGFTKTVINKYQARMLDYWKQNFKPVTRPDETQENTDEPKDLFLLMKRKNTANEKKDELERYLSDPCVNPSVVSGGAVGWWKSHACDYPALSQMARDFLSAAGSGVAIERLFSGGPDLLAPRRQSLSDVKIRECICLKAWLKAENQSAFMEDFSASLLEKLLR